MSKLTKQTYAERKAAGKCVRPGCKLKPKKNEDGTVRSYCNFHNEQNAKHSEAWKKRQEAGSKKKNAKKKAAAKKSAAAAEMPAA
jgi:hypothetical protein